MMATYNRSNAHRRRRRSTGNPPDRSWHKLRTADHSPPEQGGQEHKIIAYDRTRMTNRFSDKTTYNEAAW